jgi:hypothetical protein
LKGRWWGLPVTADVEVDDFSTKWKGPCDVPVVEIGPTRIESHLHRRNMGVAWTLYGRDVVGVVVGVVRQE